MAMHRPEDGLTAEELAAESAEALPDKEAFSILDLNADVNVAIDAAAPIDLAVAANANVAAPIDASASANLMSEGATAQSLSDQGVQITQGLDADANATAVQDSGLDQSNDVIGEAASSAAPVTGGLTDPVGTVGDTVGDTTGAVGDTVGEPTGTVGQSVSDPIDGATGGAVDGAVGDTTGTVGDTVSDTTGTVGDVAGGAGSNLNLQDGNLLNVDVNVDLDGDVAAPVGGAVAANANVAAPIDGAVAANIDSPDSHAVAVTDQDAIIDQSIEGEANASTDQQSDITQ